MIHEGVDQCAGVVTGGRMHDHALGLVDHYHILVLIYDIERYILRKYVGLYALRERDLYLISGIEPAACLRRMSVQQHGSIVYELLNI